MKWRKRERKEEEGYFLGKLSAKLERKENDKREEGRKGERNRTSKVKKKKEGGSRLQRGMLTWDQKPEAKGANKNILHHLITK